MGSKRPKTQFTAEESSWAISHTNTFYFYLNLLFKFKVLIGIYAIHTFTPLSPLLSLNINGYLITFVRNVDLNLMWQGKKTKGVGVALQKQERLCGLLTPKFCVSE